MKTGCFLPCAAILTGSLPQRELRAPSSVLDTTGQTLSRSACASSLTSRVKWLPPTGTQIGMPRLVQATPVWQQRGPNQHLSSPRFRQERHFDEHSR
jgi:hypothetical protein